MKNRILKVNTKDIIYDYCQASEIVCKACNRQIPMEVKGGFVKGNNVILCLEQIPDNACNNYKKYIFAPFQDISENGIIAEIDSRFYAGFTTIICFEIQDKVWGLFAERKDDAN
jgi:hypothetical protein